MARASEAGAEITSGTLPAGSEADVVTTSGKGGLRQRVRPIWGTLALASESHKDVPKVQGGLPDDHIDPSVFAHAKVAAGMEALRGKAMWFNSTDDFEAFWGSQQKPGRTPHVVEWSFLHRELVLIDVKEILKESVLLLCHRSKPELCHLPLHGQTFYVAVVQFVDNGDVENMLFTQHMMNPTCNPNCLPSCNPDCGYMYHALDHVLFRESRVLV